MSVTVGIATHNLTTFIRSGLGKDIPVEASIEALIGHLTRRQIRHSKACATATAHLLRRVVEAFEITNVGQLIRRVQLVGSRLILAQPRELAIGNVVRRVLGVIRVEAEENRDVGRNGYKDAGNDRRTPPSWEGASPSIYLPGSTPDDSATSPSTPENSAWSFEKAQDVVQHPPPLDAHASGAVVTSTSAAKSTLNLLTPSAFSTTLPAAAPRSPVPSSDGPPAKQRTISTSAAKEFKAEVVEGIEEILEELSQADEQIAGYTLDHIHSNEIILTHSSSATIQKFLLKAAAKRKFTVIHAEGYPNGYEATHAALIGKVKVGRDNQLGSEAFAKSLTALGIIVIMVPDSAVFALMSRVNKVLFDAHTVFSDGSLVASAGARAIAKAAHIHSTHVVVLSAVYQLSPVYPFHPAAIMEKGNPNQVVDFIDGSFIDKVEVDNPLYDYVPAELVDLYVTNLGGHARSYLYRVILDHYRNEDIILDELNPF